MKKIKKSNNSRKHAKTVRRRTVVAAKNRQDVHTPVTSQVSRVRTTASNHALLYCCMTPNIFDIGIGYVVLGRKLSLDRIATSVFMVDVYCLGVKNAFYVEYSRDQFHDAVDRLGRFDDLITVQPEYACKLVLEAVNYAQNLGFAPHEDYALAAALFGKIDPAQCPDEIVFGKDGKPFYISGPSDTPGKIRTIMKKLTGRLGEENFDFVLAA